MQNTSYGIALPKKLFLGIVSLFLYCNFIAASAQAISSIKLPGTTGMKTMGSINERGASLRKDIKDVYRIWERENRIRSMGNGRNDISSIVIKQIPIGSSFEDATKILQAAGFTLKSRGESKTLPGHYGITAEIDEYKRIAFGKITIFV